MHLEGDEDRIAPVAAAHRDPAKVELLWDVVRTLSPREQPTRTIFGRVLNSGRTEIVPELPPEHLDRVAPAAPSP